MTRTIPVIEPGSEVTLWEPDGKSVKAKVDAVRIEARDRVSYSVAFWSGTALTYVWVAADMIEGAYDGDTVHIGFRQ